MAKTRRVIGCVEIEMKPTMTAKQAEKEAIRQIAAQIADGLVEAGLISVAYDEVEGSDGKARVYAGVVHVVPPKKAGTGGTFAAYCKAVSLPIAPPKWVPIGERKPTESQEYIVLHENVAVDVLQFDAGADDFGAWEPVYSVGMGGWEGADFHRAEGVTHWLDFEIPVLPEVPEEIPF